MYVYIYKEYVYVHVYADVYILHALKATYTYSCMYNRTPLFSIYQTQTASLFLTFLPISTRLFYGTRVE